MIYLTNNWCPTWIWKTIFYVSNVGKCIIYDLIDVTGINPQPPIITYPIDSIQNRQYINITYLNGTATTPSTVISYYNISLFNSDLTFNHTIIGNNSLNTIRNV
jgi:hypothetical protein